MALYLGNLSPRVRKEELERVFTRFGRCSLLLKVGYGFAIYKSRGDAEKALRTLSGRLICGESLNLSWSIKQPRPLERFVRTARSHAMRYGRNSDQSDSFVGRDSAPSHRDYTMRDKQLEKGRERHKSDEIRDDRGNINLYDVGVVDYDQKELVLEAGGQVEVESLLMDNGKWEARIDNLQSDAVCDGQMNFDRYEPDYRDEKGEGNEIHGFEHLDGSQSLGTSPYKNKREHPGNKRGLQTCSQCGSAGHEMRDCPSKEALQETSKHHLAHRRDARVQSEVIVPRSEGRLPSSSRNLRYERRAGTDEKPSHARKDEANRRRSPVADKRNDFNRRRRRKRDEQLVEGCDDKASRVVGLSHLHSDCTSPELGTSTRPVKPWVRSASHSRSRSSIPQSLSASRSNSRSDRSSSRGFKSKSISKSSSPSSFMSSSLVRSLPSSPNKTGLNLNGFSEDAPSSPSKEVLSNSSQHFEIAVREGNQSFKKRSEHTFSRYTDNATCSQAIEVSMERNQLDCDSMEESPSSTKHTEVNLNGFGEDDQIPQPLKPVTMQKFEPQQTGVFLQFEDFSKVSSDMNLEQSHNNGGVSIGVDVSCSSLLEKGDKESAAIPEKLSETEELKNAALEMTKPLETTNNSDQTVLSRLYFGNHLSISAEELCRALKHADENEQHQDVGDYFGTSRLWPWEMIYYRRLKKGPISLENYARRVAQNTEFNIIDKYIRRSSGWGEIIEEHH